MNPAANRGLGEPIIAMRIAAKPTYAPEAIAAEGGRADVYEADVTQSGQAAAVIESVLKARGRIDHLVNNAGITRDNLFLRIQDRLVLVFQLFETLRHIGALQF